MFQDANKTTEIQTQRVPRPFRSAEAVWFWFVEAHNKAMANRGRYKRYASKPCEPVDVQNIVMRLYKTGVLKTHHLKVMTKYGDLQYRPGQFNPRERSDYSIWRDAFENIRPFFEKKGIITSQLKVVSS